MRCPTSAVIAEDPNCKGLLFAGTGNGLYYSLDDGGHWTALEEGLPHAPVSWAVVQKRFHDLVVSTYGRGLYILDDISLLEQRAGETSDAPVRVFAPRPAYRITHRGRAFLDFSLKSAPKSPVQTEILDSAGKVIRKLEAPGHQGINRVTWDLRYEPPRLVKLRAEAPDNPHVWEETRFRGAESRPVLHWGIEQAQVGPVVPAGNFTVRLTVDGQSQSQPLTVLRDPRSPGSNEEIGATIQLQLRIRDDISNLSDMANQLEWLRRQLDVVGKALRDQKADSALLKSVEEMAQKMSAIEFKLINREDANSDDKYYVEAYKPYLNLIWLNGEVGTGAGDVAGGADFAPTDAAREVLQGIEEDLAEAQTEFRQLSDEAVPAFNRSLASHRVTPLSAAVSPATPDTSTTEP